MRLLFRLTDPHQQIEGRFGLEVHRIDKVIHSIGWVLIQFNQFWVVIPGLLL